MNFYFVRFRRLWLIILVVIGFTMAGVNYSFSQTKINQSAEIRGVWLTNIDSEVLFSPVYLNNAINRLGQLNFNTIYPTVWNSGYTLYPSEVAQTIIGQSIQPEEKLQGRDFLAEIINVAHQKKMKLIPWFEFGFMAPANSELVQKHPEWLTERLDGSTIWLEGKVHERVWLNPLDPEVQEFITDLIVEIVSKYDVDGIQLDDHFGYPSDFGYDDLTIQLYQQEHNGQSPPIDYLNTEWIQWRADKITQYMNDLFIAIKSHNPHALVSVSPNPQNFSLTSFLLDWKQWERKGLIEELVLQVYRRNLTDFTKELEQPEVIEAKKHIPVAIGILSGLKGLPISSDLIKEQVKTVRHLGFNGVSFFFYESLWNFAGESPRERMATFRELFSDLK